jgi:hypothetical protein
MTQHKDEMIEPKKNDIYYSIDSVNSQICWTPGIARKSEMLIQRCDHDDPKQADNY